MDIPEVTRQDRIDVKAPRFVTDGLAPDESITIMLKLMETRVNRFPDVEFPRNVKVLIHNPYTALTCRCKCTHWQPLPQRQLSLQRCVDKANTMINSAEEGLKVRFAQQELQERTD